LVYLKVFPVVLYRRHAIAALDELRDQSFNEGSLSAVGTADNADNRNHGALPLPAAKDSHTTIVWGVSQYGISFGLEVQYLLC
jgi:hypothetical protein